MNEKLYALRIRQKYPLEMIEHFSDLRIRQWYDFWEGQVYVAFSGGKDSRVLLHKVRRLFPDVPAVFSDTGLEYPEIRAFVKTIDNVIWMRPKMNFKQVLDKYGFPILSKEISMGFDRYRNTKDPVQKDLRINGGTNPTSGRKQQRSIPIKWQYLLDSGLKFSERCCDVLKKEPFKRYEKESKRRPYVGTMVEDSDSRKKAYMRSGCNSFSDKGQSKPISFWTEAHIWEYIRKYNLSYSKIYDMGETRTGCMFCMFGLHMEAKPNRFDRMAATHPKEYNACMNKYGMKKVIGLIEAGSTPAQATMPFA